MNVSADFLGVRLKNRSVLASGILGVTLSSLKKVYHGGAGIVTTKSVGPEKRKGYHAPVVYDWGGGLINAVGLPNPGIDDFVSQYDNSAADFPIIISLFGREEGDFAYITQKLIDLSYTGLELNLSCPNVLDEFGTPFSFSPELTYRIIRNVRDISDKPLVVKLSPNTPCLVVVAHSAEDAGADALCIMNTVGPGMVINTNTGAPVLGNMKGGISGEAILPVTVRNVFEVYGEVGIPIIGTGGIADTDGALQILMAGARLYGIGSAVYTRGLSIFRDIDEGIKDFLARNRITDSREIIGLAHKRRKFSFYHGAKHSPLPERSVRVESEFIVVPVEGIKYMHGGEVKTILLKSEGMKPPKPGQFYMLWLPGEDQKPYSVSYFDRELIGFSLLSRGPFSSSLFNINKGDPLGLLGPLGKGYNLEYDNYLLVGGGIGLAPIIFSALRLQSLEKRVRVMAGGKTAQSVNWVEPLLQRGEEGKEISVYYCTEDGSLGSRGLLTGYLHEIVEDFHPDFALICGPEPFIKESLPIFRKNSVPGEASIERIMKCGIGICGSCCVDHTGDRVCVEGPVFPFSYLESLREFGSYKRDESGAVTGIE